MSKIGKYCKNYDRGKSILANYCHNFEGEISKLWQSIVKIMRGQCQKLAKYCPNYDRQCQKLGKCCQNYKGKCQKMEIFERGIVK